MLRIVLAIVRKHSCPSVDPANIAAEFDVKFSFIEQLLVVLELNRT